jgi:hypothetical protein
MNLALARLTVLLLHPVAAAIVGKEVQNRP